MERNRNNPPSNANNDNRALVPNPPFTRSRTNIPRSNPREFISTNPDLHRTFITPHSRVSTWISQNRSLERQRAYYTNFYLSRYNRSSTNVINPTEPDQTVPSTATHSNQPIDDSIQSIQHDVSNASTQTAAAAPSPNTLVAVARPDPNTVVVAPLSNITDYIRTLAEIIQMGNNSHLNNTSSNNDTNQNFPAFNAHIFSLAETNLGLTKQEINRHTVSYEYKPQKRKRMKVSASTEVEPTSSNDNCSICLDKFNSTVVVRRLPCLHVFHIKCIDKWLKRNKKCPICRISITINYDTLISSLKSGSSIDQCLSQQESSSVPSYYREILNFFARNDDNNNNNGNSSRNNNSSPISMSIMMDFEPNQRPDNSNPSS